MKTWGCLKVVKSYVLFLIELDMISRIGCFGNWYRYIHKLSVEDVLKLEVRHRPDMQKRGNFEEAYFNRNINFGTIKIRWIKRIWAQHYTEPILCKFLERSFWTNRSSLLEPKCWGEQHIRDAVNVKDFSPRTLGKIRMGRSGRKHLFNACFSRINDTRGSNNIKRVGHLFMGICTRFNITFT